jgi:hypothetical protein
MVITILSYFKNNIENQDHTAYSFTDVLANSDETTSYANSQSDLTFSDKNI